jgi:phospholipid transport system substrate-binding protein
MDQVLGIVRENSDESDKTGRRELLRAVLASRFDFREMAKRSLGQHWSRLAERQQEFVSVFSAFVENSYISKLESLKQTRVVYLREHVDSNLARIDTKIVPDRGDEVPIHYRLHLVGSEWKIYDVVVENISLVENLRSQFHRVLATATFDDLLKKLQQKTSARGG